MGDLIILCAAAEELDLDPKSFFWLIEKRSSLWAEHLGLDYLCYDASRSTTLRIAAQFDLVINSEQYFGLSQAAAIAARSRRGKLASFATNRASSFADVCVAYDPYASHEIVEFARLLSTALGMDRNLDDGLPHRTRREPPTAPPIVGIGGTLSPSRALSTDLWFNIIEQWRNGRCILLSGAGSDRPVMEQLAARLGSAARIFSGSFSELCTTMARSEEVLTMDSGFQHIASYYGIPSLTIFTSGRETKWAPLAAGSKIIRRSDLECQPCTLFGQVPPCPNNLACKELHYPEHVRSVR
jgi:ADP-heptose:LPS heptosyltransferase